LQGSNCQTPVVIPNASHVYAQYTIITKQREKLIKDLQVVGIPTSVHYPLPLHQQPALQAYYHGQDLSTSERLANEVVSLPMHPYLDEACQNKIVEAVIHSLST
ncbi:MAG: aminotransferase DegT, partial [Burkholderiales bacterium]|nr:aminotransferase DegT [Burkholderiales bacterium]